MIKSLFHFIDFLYVSTYKMMRKLIVRSGNKKRVLIVGAGAAGEILVKQLQMDLSLDYVPIAFIDDHPKKKSMKILGLPIVGTSKDIPEVVDRLNIDFIIIAIPSLKKEELNRILMECAKSKAKTLKLPALKEIDIQREFINQLVDVKIEDLIGRKTIPLNLQDISAQIKDSVVLVTGAGGSIGSEICRQIVQLNPSNLVLVGHGENSIYNVEMELRELWKNTSTNIHTVIADIKDREKMNNIMQTYEPDIVYHAAAHKHVPLMEKNPDEAVKNNCIGTLNVALAASENNVGSFVLISTDKAVNPTSVMGASKRIAEMLIQHLNTVSKTKFMAVRFGNVIGSRGSVIPLFKKQIEKGGPITITHPDMERYFMTIPEAAKLVIQAGCLGKGGEIFVLDMGKPVKILDLAKNLIQLSGHKIEDIKIEFTGLRPGEKLYEELLAEDEIHEQQIFPYIYIGKSKPVDINEIELFLQSYMNYSKEELKQVLLQIANHKKPHIQKLVQTG